MNVNEIALDKLHLCFSEIAKCKQLLDSHRADDFSGRLLSIYIMLRVDDITKIWSHSLPQKKIERLLANKVKTTYNHEFRLVRDKIGAHYQTTAKNKDVDIFENSNLFRSFDYKSVTKFIDELFAAECLIECNEIKLNGFDSLDDQMMALKAIDSLYADDKACITNSALDLFGYNKANLITCTNEQHKAQFLKGIELMVNHAYCLVNMPYHCVEDKRLFKRLLVCAIYNYHDNLYTRKDLGPTAVQYEEGFDIMYKRLYKPCDNKIMLDSAFDKFEKIYHTDEFFKRNRKVRDSSSGHFDEKSNVDEINVALDSMKLDEIYGQYNNMLNLFNFICNNMLAFNCFRIPPRTVLYNAQMVSMEGVTSFYGEKLEDNLTFNIMTPEEIMRSLRKRDVHYDEAREEMGNKLFSQIPKQYDSMIAAIGQRLCEMNDSEPDLFDIITVLNGAKRCSPNRLQRSIIDLIKDKGINNIIKVSLIWILSSICRKDKSLDMLSYLHGLIKCNFYPIQCLAFIGYLHYLMSDRSLYVNNNNKPHEVDNEFANLLRAVNNPTRSLGIWLALNQHWMLDQDYMHERKCETNYSSFLKDGLHDCIQAYYKYASIEDSEELKLWEAYEKENHYLLLLFRFAFFEKNRKQNPNAFLELWNFNCYIKFRAEVYESFGVGLMTELNGDIEMARDIFKNIVKEYPISQDAINTLSEFEERNKRVK